MCVLSPAHAEKRVALVVGNNRYANLPAHEQRQKAVSDARAVGGALQRIGSDVVSGENLGRQAQLDEAAQRLTPGDTVFFFSAMASQWVGLTTFCLPTCPISRRDRRRA
jgi:uncharacterized caspase-like protein